MIRGLYTAAAGMQTQQNRNDILSNNLANINTPGYQSKQGIIRTFPEVLLDTVRIPSNEDQSIGRLSQGVFIEESVPIFQQGDLMDTGVASNVGLYDADITTDPTTGKQPKLFFTVEDANGNRFYTRNGSFTVDALGQLVTPEGHLVLDDWNYPIQTNGREYSIDEKGYITFSDGTTAKLGLTKINDTSLLENRGNQLYIYNGNINELDFVEDGENYSIHQGKIERSNVDVNQTVTDMMTALRMYEANQKVIQSLDRTLDKAVNEIGRV